MANVSNADTVLEVGCGDGKDAYFLGTRYNVTALDIANKPDNTDTVKFYKQSMEKLSNKHDLLPSKPVRRKTCFAKAPMKIMKVGLTQHMRMPIIDDL